MFENKSARSRSFHIRRRAAEVELASHETAKADTPHVASFRLRAIRGNSAEYIYRERH
jgi:hypothetical protein